MEFRDLRADEIEVRVQSVKENGLVLLLYKDARCDMKILDETVGAENWQREHYECKGNLFCRVGININTKTVFDNTGNVSLCDRWVWKSDVGVESNADAKKGEASDSFKRACFNWGIGRELYTAPFIWVKKDHCNIEENDKNKYGKPTFKCDDKFAVEKIVIEDKQIKAISIVNTTKVCRCYVMLPTKEG